MGCGVSNEVDINGKIEEKLGMEYNQNKRTKKVLVLGSDVSGKSMLFNQLKWLYGNHGFYAAHSKDELKEMLCEIRQNMVQSMITLVNESEILYEMDEYKYAECKLDFDDEKEMKMDNKQIQTDIQYLMRFKNETFIESSKTVKELELLGEILNRLWNMDGIKNTFKYRDEFDFKENMDYFFDKSIQIFKENYICTKNDFIRINKRDIYSGFKEMILEVDDDSPETHVTWTYKLIRVNQLEYKIHKLDHLFQNIPCIIFVASLDSYCQVYYYIRFQHNFNIYFHNTIESI